MQHVKIPLPVMQEIVNILTRLPYATVGTLMPKIEGLSIEINSSTAASNVPTQ